MRNMEMTEQNNERAMIYDYKTGDVIREATAMEEQRYIAELLSMTGNQRTIGAVDGSEYDHDGSIYMQGGRVEIAAGIPNVDYDRAGRLWSEYVGQQGTDEFMWYASTTNIRDAVEEYLNSIPEDWLEDAPEDLADMLTAYIERDVRTAQLRRV
jgi:TolB-like protein